MRPTAYDPLQHLLNCERLAADPVGLGRCVQESLDYPALRHVAAVLAQWR